MLCSLASFVFLISRCVFVYLCDPGYPPAGVSAAAFCGGLLWLALVLPSDRPAVHNIVCEKTARSTRELHRRLSPGCSGPVHTAQTLPQGRYTRQSACVSHGPWTAAPWDCLWCVVRVVRVPPRGCLGWADGRGPYGAWPIVKRYLV